MRTVGLVVARVASAAWVGAAVLFVVTSVREIRSPHFDSVTKDLLVGLRFPAYYAAGLAAVGVAFLGALAAVRGSGGGRRGLATVVLLGASLALMASDYLLVYRPLEQAIIPPGRVRPEWFETYHRASMWINGGAVLLTLFAAVLLARPASPTASEG